MAKRIWNRMAVASVLAPLLVAVAGCATSPTGRKQLMIVPKGQMNAMGVQAFQQMKDTQKVDKSGKWDSYIQCISRPITDAAGPEAGVDSWELVVFDDESANAFALPGGKIGVHTGLMKVAKTDGQIAAVLGHEVGHVIAQHGNERISEAFAAQGGLAAVGVLTKDNPNRDKLMALLGLGTQVGIALPHSRTQESEADVIGLHLAARAGFDPKESIPLWQNMMAASGGKAPPEFLSTHPSGDTRIQNLNSIMPEAEAKYKAAQAEGRVQKCVRPK